MKNQFMALVTQWLKGGLPPDFHQVIYKGVISIKLLITFYTRAIGQTKSK